MNNSGENVFEGIPVGPNEASLLNQFLDAHDFAKGTRRGFVLDVRKFARWFTSANHEPFVVGRVTTRDVTDFKDYLRRERGQAVATVNRNLVTLRRFFGWLAEQGNITANPAVPVGVLLLATQLPFGISAEHQWADRWSLLLPFNYQLLNCHQNRRC